MTEMKAVGVPASLYGDEDVRVLEWRVANGERVAAGQTLVEVETSKATLELHAPTAGYVWHEGRTGDDVPVGSPVAFITDIPVEPSATQRPARLSDTPGESAARRAEGTPPPPRLSAHAERLAKELGLDASHFPAGRLVRSRDVLALASRAGLSTDAGRPSTLRAEEAAPVDEHGGERAADVPLRWEALTRRKRAEAKRLGAGQVGALPSFVTRSCAWAEERARLAARKCSASATAHVIAEVARLLVRYPIFNAVYADGRVGFYEEVNVGWALDDGEGLYVPVVRHADRKTPHEIEAESQRHAAAYVRRRFSTDDLAGGTFNISDLSGQGATSFVPLISGGQSAALGLGTHTLTLSFDHRLADGRTAAQFLNDLNDLLSLPARPAPDEAAAAEFSCSFCGCAAGELRESRAFLLRCEAPVAGYVCSLCLVNY